MPIVYVKGQFFESYRPNAFIDAHTHIAGRLHYQDHNVAGRLGTLSILLSALCPPAPLKSLTFWCYTNQIIIIIIIIIVLK